MIRPPKVTEAEVLAIQAMAKGTATADQQKQFMRFLMSELCGVYLDQTLEADHEFEVHHANGRRWVGIELNRQMDSGAVKRAREAEQTPPAARRTTKRPR